ncbi:MAG TPA: hypothetical protein PKI11_06395 [Candidatus Hydrogenedentes bacterium]|nr:hypothetical protein [Candidatus Hydrogenedentota bacterium]
MLQAQLDQVHRDLEAMRDLLTDLRETACAQETLADDLRQRYWDVGQELAALRDTVPHYDVLQQRLARFEDAYAELHERLTRILQFTKRLTGEFLQ